MHLIETSEANFIDNYKNDIYIFIELSEKFFYEYLYQVDFMKPDTILPTILFGQFGEIITKNIIDFEYHINKKLFLHIEDMLNRDDEFLSTIVVTGLLEGITSSIYSQNIEGKIIEFSGQKTKKYIKDLEVILPETTETPPR